MKNYIDNAFARNTILSELENSNSHFYFVYTQEKLIGYFRNAQNETFTKSSIELERIYIISQYQNNGF